MTDHAALLDSFLSIAAEAGRAILATQAPEAQAKQDGSPLTAADLASEGAIAAGLAALGTGIQVVSEEGAQNPPPEGAPFILVDPLDGTKEFISGNGEYTVNIALIEAGRPVLGVVLSPALGKAWIGCAGRGAQAVALGAGCTLDDAVRAPIQARPRPAALVAVASRSHADPATEAFLGGLPVAARRSMGSSLKFCLVAEGEADVYPRFAPTMEWDTAAGQAVLEAAGGRVTDPDGAPFRYGKTGAGFRNGSFIAWGAPAA